MTPDLDSLVTALHVKTDDLLKTSPELAPWRPEMGIEPRLSDAELVTLAVMRPCSASSPNADGSATPPFI